ncbi:DUF1761 domain-containing protein [Candidatus Kaiserbacteria bacterium]|nr:DUF1761 domain-containing protein [Candidatus Kaiserbacteria bacterium]
MFEINLWAILGAAVANVVLGMVWYHPKVFGSMWMRLANVSPETSARVNKQMPIRVFFGFLSSLIIAYVLANLGIILGIFDVIGAILDLAFSAWIGFVAPVLLGAVLWEGKSLKLYAINAGYWLVSLIVMSVVLLL